MFEIDEKSKKIKFSHNPFSMPQGDLSKLNLNKPLDIKAFQYDIVCNGIELSSGAISCLLYTSPSPRDKRQSRMPSSA
mgnify:CR=1 FL=1